MTERERCTLPREGFEARWFPGTICLEKAIIAVGGASCDERTSIAMSGFLRKRGRTVFAGFWRSLRNGRRDHPQTDIRWTDMKKMLCDCFPHGYLLAELHSPFLEKNSKHHDAVKNTNATFGWGTKSGREYLELEPRMTLVSETSYNEEMKKYTIRGKLFAIIGKNMNNRLAVFKW